MMCAGAEKLTEKQSAGLTKIKSRGLAVFVGEERIELFEGQWRNNHGTFDTLKDAVFDAFKRLESQ